MNLDWFWIMLILTGLVFVTHLTQVKKDDAMKRWAFDQSILYAGRNSERYQFESRLDQRPWTLEIELLEGGIGLPVWKTRAISIPDGSIVIGTRSLQDSRYAKRHLHKVEIGSPLFQQHYTILVSDAALAPQVITPAVEQALLDSDERFVEIQVDEWGMTIKHSRWKGKTLDSAVSLMKQGPQFVEAWMQYF